jgi:hypothetical protein
VRRDAVWVATVTPSAGYVVRIDPSTLRRSMLVPLY